MEEAHNGEAGRIMVHVIMGHPHVMSPSVTPTHVMNENVDVRVGLIACVPRHEKSCAVGKRVSLDANDL